MTPQEQPGSQDHDRRVVKEAAEDAKAGMRRVRGDIQAGDELRNKVAEILRSGNYGYADYATVQKLTAATLAAQKALLDKIELELPLLANCRKHCSKHEARDDVIRSVKTAIEAERQQLGKEKTDG